MAARRSTSSISASRARTRRCSSTSDAAARQTKKPPCIARGLCRLRASFASASAAGRGAPALMIGLARLLTVGRRADDHLDLGLLVALDRGLLGAAILLAPDQSELGAGLG